MKRKFLLAFAVVDVIAIAAVWRLLHDDDAPAIEAPSAAPAPKRDSRPASALPPRRAPKAEAATPDEPGVRIIQDQHDEPEEESAPLVSQNILGDVAHRLYQRAARCYSGQEGSAETIRFEYFLHVADEVASIRSLQLFSTEVDDVALIGCIENEIHNLSWDAPGREDMESKHSLSFSVQGLRSRAAKAQ